MPQIRLKLALLYFINFCLILYLFVAKSHGNKTNLPYREREGKNRISQVAVRGNYEEKMTKKSFNLSITSIRKGSGFFFSERILEKGIWDELLEKKTPKFTDHWSLSSEARLNIHPQSYRVVTKIAQRQTVLLEKRRVGACVWRVRGKDALIHYYCG